MGLKQIIALTDFIHSNGNYAILAGTGGDKVNADVVGGVYAAYNHGTILKVYLPYISRITYAEMLVIKAGTGPYSSGGHCSIEFFNAQGSYITKAGGFNSDRLVIQATPNQTGYVVENVAYVVFVGGHWLHGSHIDDVRIEFEPQPVTISNSGAADCTLGYCGQALEDGLNLRTGEIYQQVRDLGVKIGSSWLTFERIYRQSKQSSFQTLGKGWTHNHEIELTQLGGNPERLKLRLPSGGEGFYKKSSANIFNAEAGNSGIITQDLEDNSYTLKAGNGSLYGFSSSGKLLYSENASRERLDYTYDNENRLIQINGPGARRLNLRYLSSGEHEGKLYRVGDHTFDDTHVEAPSGRFVEYRYITSKQIGTGGLIDGDESLLNGVQDQSGAVWTYNYYGQTGGETEPLALNYLTQILSPTTDNNGDGIPDSQIQLASYSYNFTQNQLSALSVSATGEQTTTYGFQGQTTTQTQAGVTRTDTFVGDVLAYRTQGDRRSPLKMLDARLRESYSADAENRITRLNWSPDGETLLSIEDVNRQSTLFHYDDLHRLVAAVDIQQRFTRYIYSSISRAPEQILLYMSDENLMPNGDMEANANWTNISGYAPVTNTHVASYVYSGTYARGMTTNNVGQGIESALLSLEEGTPYEVIARVRPLKGRVQMRWSSANSESVVSNAHDDWQLLSLRYIPSSQETARLQFTSTEAVTEIYIDSVWVFNATNTLRHQAFIYNDHDQVVEERLVDPTDGITTLKRSSYVYGTTGGEVGQLISMTVEDIEGSDDRTTAYTYDTFGRLIQTQTSSLLGSCQFNFQVYDAADRVVVKACSVSHITGEITEQSIDALYNAAPEDTTVTKMSYDALGRHVTTTSYKGGRPPRTTKTLYDGQSRVIMTIENYVDDNYAPPIAWVFEEGVWKTGPNGVEVSHGNDGDQNIISRTHYNARGQTRATQDVFGNVTLYGYDESDRLVKTIRNASVATYNNDYLGTDPDFDLSEYVAAEDVAKDIITTQNYDAVGNLIHVIDALGQVTFTVYDALNRPVKTVANAKASARVDLNVGDTGYDAANDPRSEVYVASLDPDRDQIDITEYDVMGRVIRTSRLLENRFGNDVWERTLYGYDDLGQQVRTVRYPSEPNYDIQADPTLQNYQGLVEAGTDADHITETVYDAQGRVRYTVGVNGQKSWSVYDGFGRVIKHIQNCTYVSGSPAPEESTYMGQIADESADIITETFYDGDGRVQKTRQVLTANATEDDLIWSWTLYGYDALGRQVKTVTNASNPLGNFMADLSNYTAAPSATADQDRMMSTTYDSNGQVRQSIDTAQNVTLYGYDVAGRRIKTVQNASNPEGSFTIDLSDYTPASPDVDQDRISTTQYGLAGRVISTTDDRGRVQRIVYDDLGRQILMIQNYVAQATPPTQWGWENGRWEDGSGNAIDHGVDFDQNLISTTTYNKGGQTVVVRDRRGTQTLFHYDQAGRRQRVQYAVGINGLETVNYHCYDKGGRLLRSIQNWFNQGYSPDSVANENWLFNPSSHGALNDQNLVTAWVYDGVGRRTKHINPRGAINETRYHRDGQVFEQVDANGSVTRYHYDHLGRQIEVIAGYGTPPPEPPPVNCDITVAAGDVTALIDAIVSANSSGSPMTLCLQGGIYSLTAVHNSASDGSNGLPVITGNITLWSEGAVIERDSSAPLLRLFKVNTSGRLVLNGITLRGGNSGTSNGGAVRNLGTLELVNVVVEQNTGADGGAIRNNNNATLLVTNSIIRNNNSTTNGGAIYSNVGSNTTLINSTLSQNTVNTTNGLGGGIFMNGATLSVTGGSLDQNTARNGGGIFFNAGTTLALNNMQIMDNSAAHQGGGVYVSSGEVVFTDVTLSGNSAAVLGGAIRNGASVILNTCTITANQGGSTGGGGLANLDIMTLNNSVVSNNTLSSSSASGGGIYNQGTLNINGGMLSYNEARNGAGIFINDGDVDLVALTLTHNHATNNGGAIYLLNGATLTGNSITLSANSATNYGGGLSGDGVFTITLSHFSGNNALQGGAIYTEEATLSNVQYSCIEGNSATQGGGIYSNVAGFDARFNGWGAADGPSGAGPGTGDAVNANVNFADFLTDGCST